MEFRSKNNQFGLSIERQFIDDLHDICRQNFPNETGGIITGFYTDTLDCAVVTKLTKPPRDSKAGRTWFYRGVQGLQSFLNQIWKNQNYYLGEWHFHPLSSACPSSADITQMNEIAASSAYRCPEPVLIILGGDPSNRWHLQAYVFRHGEEMIELIGKTL